MQVSSHSHIQWQTYLFGIPIDFPREPLKAIREQNDAVSKSEAQYIAKLSLKNKE